MNTTGFLIVQLSFVLITIVFFGLFISEVRQALQKTSFDAQKKKRVTTRMILSLVVWTTFVSVWSLNGMMGRFDLFPFNMMPILLVPLVTILALTYSKTFAQILVHIPPQNIVRLQSFRIFVEILLWALFVLNLAPVQMSFEGRNFDVLSGITAIGIAYLLSRQKLGRSALIAWNLAGLALLLNILIIALLSMPTPLRQFMNEPANTIVTVFTVSWLPGLLVPLAYGLHLLSLRQLTLLSK